MRYRLVYLLIFIFSRNCFGGKKYRNYTLYRAVAVDDSHMDFFLKLSKRYDVNFWREPGLMYRPIDFVINPKDREDFLKDAQDLGIFYTKVIGDVQRAFDRQTVMTYIRREMTSMNWNNYFRLQDINNWLEDLSRTYPEHVSIQNIGKSHEQRQINALKVLLPGPPKRPVIIIEGGIHAREWISPAVVTYLINSIVFSEKSSDSVLRHVAHAYEWYFVPVLNPDGYEYTHTQDRQWRKNRNGNGVDLNRNFGHVHGTVGASPYSVDENYCGPNAFSEKESLAMSNFVKTVAKRLKFYISFHSYGQYMIIPYASSAKHTENFDEVYTLCNQAGEKIFARHKTKYDVGTAYETVGYRASGMSACWVKKTYKIPYVVTIELRDTGAAGFALPPEQIQPTCEETLDGMLVLFNRPTNITHVQRIASGQTFNIMDQIVIVVNVILFIIARFD